jgi:hypothetical protein
MEALFRRVYEPARLLAEHPPVFRHPHKQLLFELACPPGATHRGTIEVTRWRAPLLADEVTLHDTAFTSQPNVFQYGADAGVWYVNFADSRLFVAYGSPLLAQDELQAVEHPVLGSIREALLAENLPALTLDRDGPSPILVTGVERRCAFTGIYGHAFAVASERELRAATHLIDPPTRTNLIAIAAPSGRHGRYTQRDLRTILGTAVGGFTAARLESKRLWPDAPVELHTGFWGCGAFGGNRHCMVLLQLLAARISRIDRLVFHTVLPAGLPDFHQGATDLRDILVPDEPLSEILERIEDLGYVWGESDGT